MFLRRLNLDLDADRSVASEIFLSNPSYELENYGRLPTHDMVEPLWRRFPEGCSPEHRLTFAAYERDQPRGLAQIALHTPTPDCAALLLLVVPQQFQQRHVGCEIVERLSKQARRWSDISSWYVTVVESNTGALAFWRHCGFRTKAQGVACNGFADRLTLMTRLIKARPSCQHSRAPENESEVTARQLFARLS
jgi:GNAT superfamily N-acetyltransferase